MNGGRIIGNSQVRNLRDYGGWQTLAGEQIATGRLLRSGHWADAKKEAHGLLVDLGAQVMVDLRRKPERQSQPNILPAESQIDVLTSDGGDMQEPPHLRFLREGNLTRDRVQAYMKSAYRRIPDEAHHQQLFRQTILHLAQGKTVLIHCAAGKDRTGILAALILGLLGVSQETIFEDYLLTNIAVDIEAVLPGIAEQISKRLGKKIKPEALYPMLGVEAGFLDEAQKVIGDPVRYAREKLQVEAVDLSRLKTSLIG